MIKTIKMIVEVLNILVSIQDKEKEKRRYGWIKLWKIWIRM